MSYRLVCSTLKKAKITIFPISWRYTTSKIKKQSVVTKNKSSLDLKSRLDNDNSDRYTERTE